jgi:polysaccharide biosynthesis transport protein
VPLVGKQNSAYNKTVNPMIRFGSRAVQRLTPAKYRNGSDPASGKRRGTLAEKEVDDTRTFTFTHPRSTAAEEMRLLRVNLDFASIDNLIKTIYITSPSANDGKSSIAINLAIVMAQGGKKVLLLDADLRRPSIDSYLELDNRKGLSDLLRYDHAPESVMQEWKQSNLAIITTGLIPANPADLLTSRKMEQVMRQIEAFVDVVIIDGPPMAFPDSVALSKKVDAVLMVVTHAATRKGQAHKMLKQLVQVGARVVGIVFNKVPYKSMSYNYYSYYSSETELSNNGQYSINDIEAEEPV